MDSLIQLLLYRYQYGVLTHTLFTYVHPDFWIPKFQSYFPDKTVHSHTDFNYDKCFTIWINLSDTDADLTEQKFDDFLNLNGTFYILKILISVLGPYAMVIFAKYYRENGETKLEISNQPFLEEHKVYQLRLAELIKNENLNVFDDDTLDIIIPGMVLELTDNEASVYNCLFQDRHFP